MKYIYELDKEDIVQVLANYYNVCIKDVDLTVKPVIIDSGIDERTEYRPVATIQAKANNQR